MRIRTRRRPSNSEIKIYSARIPTLAVRRLQARFGMSESLASTIAHLAGLEAR